MADTKSCNLTENEIKQLIWTHGRSLGNAEDTDERIERINYLNKRLKAFREPDTETKPAAAGWGTPPKE